MQNKQGWSKQEFCILMGLVVHKLVSPTHLPASVFSVIWLFWSTWQVSEFYGDIWGIMFLWNLYLLLWKKEKSDEPHRDKTNKMACAPSEDSDQPGRPPSLIRVFAVRLKKARILSYPLSASKDSDWTGRTPRLIWVFAGRTATLLVLSWDISASLAW